MIVNHLSLKPLRFIWKCVQEHVRSGIPVLLSLVKQVPDHAFEDALVVRTSRQAQRGKNSGDFINEGEIESALLYSMESSDWYDQALMGIESKETGAASHNSHLSMNILTSSPLLLSSKSTSIQK